jgi:hypothetical protein
MTGLDVFPSERNANGKGLLIPGTAHSLYVFLGKDCAHGGPEVTTWRRPMHPIFREHAGDRCCHRGLLAC